MRDLHLKHWPEGVPHQLNLPDQAVAQNLADTAARVPDRVAIHYHGCDLTYGDLAHSVDAVAGWLQAKGVARGDRVLLYMQNAPQFVIAFYAILRADAAVVPVNPMNRTAEIEHLASDTGARVVICGAELLPFVQPLFETGGLPEALVAAYADMADPRHDIPLPEPLAAVTEPLVAPGVTPFRAALAAGYAPKPALAGPDDLAVIPYSSGTTGQPKGCVHTHRSVMATIVGSMMWNPTPEGAVHLVTLPLFHVTGMQTSMNGPVLVGDTIVLMTRWDRRTAAALIQRHRVARWRSIATMAIDMVNDPDLARFDLSSLEAIGGGGAAMPEAVADRLKQMTGLDYIEGYGLSETMAATHINPLHRPKRQCLGIPVMEVDARILDLSTGQELGPNQPGEIVMHAPQVFQGYWRNEEATREAFVDIDGKRFFRTGDIGMIDDDGYFFMVDRVKRMINASGFKVWPAEVETLMHHHPDLAEVCIVGAQDPRRGETVKAYAVRRNGCNDVTESDVIHWCRDQMAAYKCPKSVEFVDSLPRSGTGKVLWRELAAREAERADAR